MHRRPLLDQLARHVPFDQTEQAMLEAMVAFVERRPDCFLRSVAEGHLTASAWILDPAGQLALLTHHAKLDKWLQLGGHADGDTDLLRVALREAAEESGLTSIQVLSGAILDVDVHPIPARPNEPEHLHYDVRFLLEALPSEPLRVTSESKSLAWVPLEEVAMRNGSPSVLRLVHKTGPSLTAARPHTATRRPS